METYNDIKKSSLLHFTINHLTNFIEPITGAKHNNMVNLSIVKRRLRKVEFVIDVIYFFILLNAFS